MKITKAKVLYMQVLLFSNGEIIFNGSKLGRIETLKKYLFDVACISQCTKQIDQRIVIMTDGQTYMRDTNANLIKL